MPLGSVVENPLNISFSSQFYPVYRFTFAYSNGFSAIARATPDSIPAKKVLYSIPPVRGIYVFKKALSCQRVLKASKVEKNADERAAVPSIGGTIPLKKPMVPYWRNIVLLAYTKPIFLPIYLFSACIWVFTVSRGCPATAHDPPYSSPVKQENRASLNQLVLFSLWLIFINNKWLN